MKKKEFVPLFTNESFKLLPINYHLISKVYYTKEEVKRFNLHYSAHSSFHQTSIYDIFHNHKPITNIL
ncbi:hypothetical protein SAMN05216324_113108 [Chryseobacterium limigenitum]|uniref:Uncharacterized protein n=1 Tax=Chryseobacterium limigenitum TaxID=1612149 RepID=A0A1K2IVW6_9FLAO|nr:hypothetical protein SAMN05216324_113108 [Chryseobacterium limigenitum]